MRIQFLLLALSFIFVAAEPQIDFLTATVADLLALLESGEVTSEKLVKDYLSRVEENNYKGLQLRAVLEAAPYDKLIQEARCLDSKRKNGRISGPLHGIPFLVKDNIATDVSLGMNTTAGSYALGSCNLRVQ
jgi:amidase